MSFQHNLRFVGFSLLTLIASPSGWAESGTEIPSNFCTLYSDLARAVMADRQAGKPMSGQMNVTGGKQSPSADLLHHLVIEAYEIRRHSSKQAQQETISDFENNAHLRCVKRLGKR